MYFCRKRQTAEAARPAPDRQKSTHHSMGWPGSEVCGIPEEPAGEAGAEAGCAGAAARDVAVVAVLPEEALAVLAETLPEEPPLAALSEAVPEELPEEPSAELSVGSEELPPEPEGGASSAGWGAGGSV